MPVFDRGAAISSRKCRRSRTISPSHRIRIIDPRAKRADAVGDNWYTEEATNYMFKQDPATSTRSALCRINFPSKWTASTCTTTALKNCSARTCASISSGCVRVQNVRELVNWLLIETPNCLRAEIDEVIKSGEAQGRAPEQARALYWVDITAWAKRPTASRNPRGHLPSRWPCAGGGDLARLGPRTSQIALCRRGLPMSAFSDMMDPPCVAKKKCEAGVRSCTNVSGLSLELTLRAIMEIRAHPISLATYASKCNIGVQFSYALGRPILHPSFSLADLVVKRLRGSHRGSDHHRHGVRLTTVLRHWLHRSDLKITSRRRQNAPGDASDLLATQSPT